MTIRNVKPKVEKFLKYQSHLRSSDKKLLLAYWASEGLVLDSNQVSVFMLCTPAESITRTRRALQAKYPANEAVEQQRFVRYIEERDEHGEMVVVQRYD